MKVSELIEKLNQFNPDMKVVFRFVEFAYPDYTPDEYHQEIVEVKEIEIGKDQDFILEEKTSQKTCVELS